MYGAHWKGRTLDYSDLENFRRNGLTDGLDGWTRTDGLKHEDDSNVIFVYEIVSSIVGERFFREIYTSGVGNPMVVEHKGYRLTSSDVISVYNAWQLKRFVPHAEKIVEIGPGFGALSRHLRRLYPDAHITLVDLPEHSEFQRYYLQNTVGLKNYGIGQNLPDDADLVIALRCLMEMPPTEVKKYFEWMQSRPSIKAFYTVNRYAKQEAVLKEYPFDAKWGIAVSQPAVPQNNMHEYLLFRMKQDNPSFLLQLDSLPIYMTSQCIVDIVPKYGIYR